MRQIINLFGTRIRLIINWLRWYYLKIEDQFSCLKIVNTWSAILINAHGGIDI